uniref:Uncharacterized protein n=1 Tax=Periophthalmus magnuspinnatus TaxID=409849 RepID=A0A3B4BAV8_9GOBI
TMCGKGGKVYITEDMLRAIVVEQSKKGPTGRNQVEQLEFYISRIERLWEFTSLTTLHLNNNNIQKMEGLSRLTTLKCLKLQFWKTWIPLRNLFLLTWPITEEENYKLFIIAFFPNVKYLDYRYVNSEIVSTLIILFYYSVIEDLEREKKTEALKAQQAELQTHVDAFVESLNGSFLFEHMFKDDPLENKLQSVPEIAQKMTELCVQLFETGLVEHRRRQAEVNSFFTSHSLTTADIMQKETKLLGEFEKYFKEVNNLTFSNELTKLQKHLLTLEFKLISQIEVELEDKYHEKMQGIVTSTIEKVSRHHGVEDLSDDVKMVFLDKETVMGALTTAHENHLLIIRDRENQMITRANAWKSRLIKKLQEKEIQRNRKVLSHITTCVDHYDEELHKLFSR